MAVSRSVWTIKSPQWKWKRGRSLEGFQQQQLIRHSRMTFWLLGDPQTSHRTLFVTDEAYREDNTPSILLVNHVGVAHEVNAMIWSSLHDESKVTQI